jgi:hypothetical protein
MMADLTPAALAAASRAALTCGFTSLRCSVSCAAKKLIAEKVCRRLMVPAADSACPYHDCSGRYRAEQV